MNDEELQGRILEEARMLREAKEVVREAEVKAKDLVDRAAEHAKELLKVAVETSKEKLYIDISRVPLICQSVIQINKDIGEIKEMFTKADGDHEGRIRTLEKTIWKWVGLSMVVPPIVTILVAWIINHFIR